MTQVADRRLQRPDSQEGDAMTTIERPLRSRDLSTCPARARLATAVVPAVSVAVRWLGGRLLLVRRCADGLWELPGACVRVGETAVDAAVRSTAEQAGVQGVIRELLQDRRIPYLLVSAATLKKFACDNGRADKAQMRRAWLDLTGIDNPRDDEVDAAWLPTLRQFMAGGITPQRSPLGPRGV